MQNYSFLLFVLTRYSRVYSTRLSTRSRMRSVPIAPKARGLSHLKQLAPSFWTSVFNIKSFRNDALADCDALSGFAVIPPEKYKNGKAHPVPLNEAAMEVINRKIGVHPTYVFTFRGKPVTQVSTKAWREALVRAGVDNFRWHDLPHTFATWHRQAGMHELQRLGGWKTLSMVERCAHVATEGLQLAAGRLDNALRGYAMATLNKKGNKP